MSFGKRYDDTTMSFMSGFVDQPQSNLDVLIKEAAEVASPRALKIFNMANETHSHDWWQWEPETLVATFGDKDLDVLQALQLVVNTNQAHEHWHVFEKFGHAINNNVVDFSVVQPLRTDECALTLKVLRDIRPKETFDQEIFGYVACCAKNDGLVYLPNDLFGKEFQSALDYLGNDEALKAKVIAGKPVDNETDIQLKSIAEIRDYVGGKP